MDTRGHIVLKEGEGVMNLLLNYRGLGIRVTFKKGNLFLLNIDRAGVGFSEYNLSNFHIQPR